jgi:hypothetical protein
VRAAGGAHHEYECAECGSPWEIEQEGTLTSHRLGEVESGREVAADGSGAVREQELRDRWPSARAAATVGERPRERAARKAVRKRLEGRESPGFEEVVAEVVMGLKDPPPPEEVERICREERVGVDRSEVVGIERPPKWKLKSVWIGDTEHPASAGGGVQLAETLVPDGPERVGPGYSPEVHGEGRWKCPECGEYGVVERVVGPVSPDHPVRYRCTGREKHEYAGCGVEFE